MGYKISLKKKQKYILVQLSGNLTESDIDAALNELLTIREKEKISNILCSQIQLRTPPSSLVIFNTAERFSKGPFVGFKLAILRKNLPKGKHFFETATTNRGGLVKVFDDKKKAKLWLAS